MSIRAFAISAAVGFGLSVGLGVPVAAALIYGAIAGAIGAAISSAPPVSHGVTVIPSHGFFHRPWFGGWFGHSHRPHTVLHQRTHISGTHGHTHPAPAPQTGGLFGLWNNHRTPVNHHTTGVGHGTRNTFGPTLPTNRVQHTRIMRKP